MSPRTRSRRRNVPTTCSNRIARSIVRFIEQSRLRLSSTWCRHETFCCDSHPRNRRRRDRPASATARRRLARGLDRGSLNRDRAGRGASGTAGLCVGARRGPDQHGVGVPSWLKGAVRTEFYIKIGLVILGASILFDDLMQVSLLGIAQALLVVTAVWFVCFKLARMLRVDDEFATMLASAVSICGVSAAIAACGATGSTG